MKINNLQQVSFAGKKEQVLAGKVKNVVQRVEAGFKNFEMEYNADGDLIPKGATYSIDGDLIPKGYGYDIDGDLVPIGKNFDTEA